MKTVAIFTLAEEAYIFRSYLASHGLEAFVRDDTTATLDIGLSNALRGVKVDVAAEDYAKAVELRDSAKADGAVGE